MQLLFSGLKFQEPGNPSAQPWNPGPRTESEDDDPVGPWVVPADQERVPVHFHERGIWARHDIALVALDAVVLAVEPGAVPVPKAKTTTPLGLRTQLRRILLRAKELPKIENGLRIYSMA